MGELLLTEQDAELLAEALELLLRSTEGIGNLIPTHSSISALLEQVRAMSGVELPQAVLTIKRALRDIAAELELPDLGVKS